MAALISKDFWPEAARSVGALLSDGSLQYVVLDKRYAMRPLIRNVKTMFTDFCLADAGAKSCKVIVNGNYYGLSGWSVGASASLGYPDDPKDTLIQGQIVIGGAVKAGDSRPQSFWFGQLAVPTTDPYGWAYTAAAGDPPKEASTIAAIGGVGPMIVNSLEFGAGNAYRSGAPPGIAEPLTGEPPPAVKPYLIQRNNETFKDVNRRAPETGKTILAYCSAKRAVFVAVQQDGASPGQTHANLAHSLAQQGFDTAVFLDGSDSATMILNGKIVVAPGKRKNDTIDVGVGFFA